MQYRHLYYLVKIVEAGSFSQAARTIHVAQPALSQQIAELEAPLEFRCSRGVREGSGRPRLDNGSTRKRLQFCAVMKPFRV